MGLFKWLFNKSDKAKHDDLHDEIARLRDQYDSITTRLRKSEQERTTFESKIATISSKIREQTEADLYFTSMKIMKKLEAGELRKVPSMQELAKEQQKMLAMASASHVLGPSIMGGTLSALFGL